jgi:hypothetical protein
VVQLSLVAAECWVDRSIPHPRTSNDFASRDW